MPPKPSAASTVTRDMLLNAAETAFEEGFGAVLSIKPNGMAPIIVDGSSADAKIDRTAENFDIGKDAQLVWRSNPDTLMSIFTRKRALESAYLSGRLMIAGDMSAMARLMLKAK